MGILASILLNVVNIILESINRNFIVKIGHNSKSRRDSIILFTNFLTQFFNTGIILLLCNSNLSYSILSFIPIYNSFVDISYHWYTATGTSIVIVMIISAVSPCIEILIEFLIQKLVRSIDNKCYSGCCCKERTTKCLTVYQYIQLYSGSEYLMQNRYNPVIVQVYVAFMFGLVIPFLFPLTLFGILIKYFIERLTITYFYRQPPMYNKRLSQEAINILKFAPTLMFLISYWALGNVQIFENKNSVQMININN